MQNSKYQRNNVGWYSLDNVLLKTWTQPGRACAGRRDHKMEWGGLKKATGTERDKWNNWAEQFLHLRCTLSHLGSFYKDWPWIPTRVKPGHGGFDQLPRYSHLHPQLSHCLRRKKKKNQRNLTTGNTTPYEEGRLRNCNNNMHIYKMMAMMQEPREVKISTLLGTLSLNWQCFT